MYGNADETVGNQFDVVLLREARDITHQVVVDVAKRIQPGMTETEGKGLLMSSLERHQIKKQWHAPQIRFGLNTVLPFGKKGSSDIALKGNDIFFLDLGLIYQDHEGDVGRPFVLGNDPEMVRCCKDAKEIWHEVRNYWSQNDVQGAELYAFAERCASKRGWKLNLSKANGHRIADFPHAVRGRGAIETFEGKPAADRWILEIQISHPENLWGAFFEDLLN